MSYLATPQVHFGETEQNGSRATCKMKNVNNEAREKYNYKCNGISADRLDISRLLDTFQAQITSSLFIIKNDI